MPPELPDFELIRPIGQGGFGQVWLATNRTTGHLRAVKLIALGSPGAANPAGREITSLTRLEENLRSVHPNLSTIHHVGKTDDYLFYVMDPADDIAGKAASTDVSYRPATLRSVLDSLSDRQLLAPGQCLDYARQLLAGLASLHQAGMVHRDVKPANCLFVGGVLKLADFGLLTDAGPQVSRLGTHGYMPPDGRMDTRADVYAAGLVIYEMLTGLPAESFPRLGEAARRVAEDAISHALNRLVLRACQPDPHERFSDSRQMLDELEKSLSQGTSAATGGADGMTLLSRLVRRPMVAVTSCLAAVAVIVAAVTLWPTDNATSPPQTPASVEASAAPAAPASVDVSFITEPFEATIYLDGIPVLAPSGDAYTTPCTVPNLPARAHRVTFKHESCEDFDAGEIDFAPTREISAVLRDQSP